MFFVFVISSFQLCVSEKTIVGRSYDQVSGLVNIQYCYFSRTEVQNGNGGVVYLYNTNSQLQIYDSGFYNCSSLQRGGAVYSYISGYSNIERVCGYRCKSGVDGYANFIEIMSSNNINMRMTSCFKSSYFYTSYMSIYFSTGNQVIQSVNISESKNKYASTMSSWKASSLDCSNCHFVNNYASEHISIWLDGGKGTQVFSNNNFINNTQGQSTYGFMYIKDYGEYSLTNSVLDLNSHTLFVVVTGRLTVSHCSIARYDTFTTGVVTTNNIRFQSASLYPLSLYYHPFCADIFIEQTQTFYISKFRFIILQQLIINI